MTSRFLLLLLAGTLGARASAQQLSPLPSAPFVDETPNEMAPLVGSVLDQTSPAAPDLRASIPALNPRAVPRAVVRTAPPNVVRAATLPAPPDDFYQTPQSLYPWLERVARARGDRVKLRIIGDSVSGGSIVAMEIVPRGQSIWKLKRLAIICRQHGNEPEATASGARFLHQWLSSTNDLKKRIAARTALLIIPIANPDGAARYERRTLQNIDMNRDWGRNKSPEVRALTNAIARFKPHLVVDNHQWLPDHHMPPPMAEASGGARAKRAAKLMSQRNAQRGYALAARSRWGLDTLAHRFWGQRQKTPAILLETRHRPNVAGARTKAIEQALAALWGAAESLGK